MKYSEQPPKVGHRVEIVQNGDSFLVSVDGRPLTRPSFKNELPVRVRFTTSAAAFTAAEEFIAKSVKRSHKNG